MTPFGIGLKSGLLRVAPTHRTLSRSGESQEQRKAAPSAVERPPVGMLRPALCFRVTQASLCQPRVIIFARVRREDRVEKATEESLLYSRDTVTDCVVALLAKGYVAVCLSTNLDLVYVGIRFTAIDAVSVVRHVTTLVSPVL